MDLSFQHLQLEFARLDILLHRQIQQQQATAVPSDGGGILSQYHLSETQAYTLLQHPFGHGSPSLDDETAHSYSDALAQAEQQIAALVAQAEAKGSPVRLQRLAVLLGLDRFDLDALLISLAPPVDPRYSKLYGYLQDDLTQKRPSLNLILDLLCPPGPERLARLVHFGDDAPLLRHRLVARTTDPNQPRPLLIQDTLAPDDAILTWLLLGQYDPGPARRSHLAYQPHPTADPVLLPAGLPKRLFTSAAKDALLIFTGQDRLGQRAAARRLAAEQGRPLLILDLTAAARNGVAPVDAVQLALRDALLIDALPFLTGWDSCLNNNAPAADLLDLICRFPDLILICGQIRWQLRHINRQRRLHWFDFPVPDYEQRRRLLRHFLQDTAVSTLNLDALAGQFLLTAGQLRDLVNTAQDMATQDGRALHDDHLFAAARAHSNPKLETLARKLTPRYTWQDLILPDDQVAVLREMVDTVRSRPIVLEQWGVGKKLAASAGVSALFFGPPGTGKTMAAEVIARELGLDVYKIDLSSMVSKYIGETEKNLERIFTEAESSNAILFFDEADAVFGKRSEVKDAHDRYANIEVSYLLQRMEAYNGVTILATNLRANLDDAFMRRLQFAVDFPFPKEKDRLRIWKTLFPPDVPQEGDLDLALLAERFEIAGGNIRNIIVSAAYLAAANGQVVNMEHLLHGTRRELQKLGRLVNERDLIIEK